MARTDNSVTMEEKQGFLNIPVTLDGEPAKIVGISKEFGTVRSRKQSVEFAWATIKRIVDRDAKFKS